MGSSNRHWPSLFKSKPSCNHHEFTSPHFSSSPSSFKSSTPNFPSPGGADGSPAAEERTPDPKPRWNPKPEQIRILEAIFNSGMVNPPREEIKKIRAQLQEYGQVGDANVFYWFQNRKSRSKQKNRQLLHKSTAAAMTTINPQTPPLAPVAPSSSSSSSSDRSSPNKFTNSSSGSVLESPTPHQAGGYTFHPHHHQNDAFLQQELAISPPPAALPFFFPVSQGAGPYGGGELCFNEITPTPVTSVGVDVGGGGGLFPSFPSVGDQGAMGTFSGLLLGDMMGASRRSMFEEEEDKMAGYEPEELGFMVTNPTHTNTIHNPAPTPLALPPPSQFQGGGDAAGGGRMPKSTVFINDVSFEVPAVGPFNPREVFGEDVVLLHQSGHPVPTNEWGLTLHPLQHGACYFLARTLASKHHHSPAPPHDLFHASQFPFQL